MMRIEARGITYRPSRAWTLLDDVRLGVESGELITIYGENGCGKTTLLQVLAGVVRPDRGDICFRAGSAAETSNITRWPLWRRARCGIAYLPQQNRVWAEMSPEDHWSLGAGVGQRPANPCSDRIRRIRDMLPAVANAGQLSHGQQRLLLLLRCLMMSPAVLLADEPTAGLDKATQEMVVELLGAMIGGGMSAIVVEHDREALARLGSRTLQLEGGRLRDV